MTSCRFAALGGDEVFDIGFDANKVVQHQYFQKLLQVPQLSRLLRKGGGDPSLPKHLIPKRFLFILSLCSQAKFDAY